VSIKPPSDLLLDVARAADPTKSSAAAERLARIAADPSVDEEGFTGVLDGVESPAPTPALPTTELSFAAKMPAATDADQPNKAEVQAYRGIEALVLQSLVENMLPDSDEFFGEEAGASVWKSMLAQELGTDLSKHVDLGVGPKRGAHRSHHIELNSSLAAAGAAASRRS